MANLCVCDKYNAEFVCECMCVLNRQKKKTQRAMLIHFVRYQLAYLPELEWNEKQKFQSLVVTKLQLV